ncbi:MAG: DPP IV N-terminal domain-containing protein, partial [Muribaculaceae bacterium]|nr:DPP IV N-terminal domain-containing protein [Muribaculaceae bacterium]
MMKLFKKYLLCVAAVSLSATAAFASGARSPYVSEIAQYVYPENMPSSPSNLVYMPDGQSYLTLSADHSKILRFDTKTGKEIEAFVDFNHTRETQIPDIEGFILSPNAGQVLVYRNRTPIYRRSFTAEYYVYEVRTRLLRPLSTEHTVQRSPIFSPNSRMVAFVSDNNIYIKKLDYNTEVAVTEDGRAGEIINGVSDWTYEEEFSTTCSMSFAPDNSTLCFVKYNETDVPMYYLSIYSGSCNPDKKYALYPGIYSYKYPVAGETNSRVTLHSYDVETRKVKDVDMPDKTIEYIPNIHYAPTGVLIVPTLNRDQNRLEIYSVNPKSTVVKSIYVEQSSAWI